MGWVEYWDGKPTIYVNRRHRKAHCRSVANGIIAYLAGLDNGGVAATVLDYGCGEALSAGDVASRCRQLYLCDAAPSVRDDLARRFHSTGNINVVAPDSLGALPAGSVDFIVANSVAQYFSTDQLAEALATWKRLLAPNGRILLADIIPRDVGPAKDALALLSFAVRNGFLLAAIAGLFRTLFSDYRQIRATLGLRQFDEAEMIAILGAEGLDAKRVHPNLGHNQSRMAFMATAPAPR